MGISQELLEILACPKCKGDLELNPKQDGLVCKACKLLYRIEDDIPIMLIDEAETVDDAEHDRLMAKAQAEGIKPTFEQ